MTENHSIENEFLKRITDIIGDNISSEQFGVSELAGKTNMSRSNLLRKVKKLSGSSVSQFIRQVRLNYAMELLKEEKYTVSEVSYKAGFGSISYFIKCFRDFYGFPPGEANKKEIEKREIEKSITPKSLKAHVILPITVLIVILAAVLFVVFDPFSPPVNKKEKSIAVLPFKNDSNDSTNVYFINGLMEATLNNLQKIKNVRVISRTSVEKYRNHLKTIPEIARELDVDFLIEGSGQKIGDQILLNIQLIEARTDKHLWANQFNKEVSDIFGLQAEIAKNIADEIEVVITPEEEKRISKVPTYNMAAYDSFLKGLDLLNNGTRENLMESIPYFREAISLDDAYARAYAGVAIAYYLLDENQAVKQYTDSISFYAEKAMFYDARLPQSLIAKALFYMNTGAYEQAVTYFEKALEYNPNSDVALAFLVNLYVNYLPDTRKYLKYALQGIRLNIASYDSVTRSVIYLHLSNAFIQSGFIDEAEKYINLSLSYDPENLYSTYVKAYILYASHRDLHRLNEQLVSVIEKDTTRLDIMQEVAKSYYYLKDYEHAYRYYKKFADIRKSYNLNIFRTEDVKIGYVCLKLGKQDEAEKYFSEFREYAENDPSVYKEINLAMYFAGMGKSQQALEHLKRFSEQEYFHYWTVIYTDMEPLFEDIKGHPEFRIILNDIREKFWKWNENVKATF